MLQSKKVPTMISLMILFVLLMVVMNNRAGQNRCGRDSMQVA
jgi:hypothetical protein